MSFRIFFVIGLSLLGFFLIIEPTQAKQTFEKTVLSKTNLTILVGKARVFDGDTLEINGQKIRLHGIDAPENAQKCIGDDKEIIARWRCGKTAKNRMIDMTKGQDVSCKLRKKDDFDRWIGECFVSDVSLNRQMVLQGMAWAFRKYSMDFIAEEQKAKRKGLGVWRAHNETAWAFRAKKWQISATENVAPKKGCVIKGNISRRDKKEHRIYHLPWFKSYGRTKISEKKGERWFCSEKEAIKAGWRRAYSR